LLPIGVQPDEAGSFQVFEPGGCRTCNDRGYKGRVALYEVMPLWDSLKELVINGASTAELKAEAIRLGMQTLRMAGIAKLKSGMTSIEELVGKTASRVPTTTYLPPGAVAAAFRTSPSKIFTFQELGLPPIISELAKKPRGLVLVTRPTGSGKSTTLASIIDKINTERHEHIVTV